MVARAENIAMKDRSASKGESFLKGFAAGLAAPVLLISGSLQAPLQLERASPADAVAKARGYINAGGADVKRLSGRRV